MKIFQEGTLIEKTANGWIVKDDISQEDVTDLGFRTKHVFTNSPEGFEDMMNHLTDVLDFDMSDGFGGLIKSRNIKKDSHKCKCPILTDNFILINKDDLSDEFREQFFKSK